MLRPPIDRTPLERGFTLIEAIVVITITGILFSMVAIFIRWPIAGAIDVARRTAMSDTADLALRRMKREIQGALPNSVRVTQTAGASYIEFVPVLAGGRYCSENCSVGATVLAPLTFNAPVSSFSVVGPLVSQPNLSIASQATQAVVFNLGIPGEQSTAPSSSVYDTGNANPNYAAVSALASAGGVTTVTLSAAKQFPLESPGNRFHLVGPPVSYVCTYASANGSGSGELRRYTGYATQSAQPATAAFFAGLSGSLLAEHVSACDLNFTQALTNRYGLLGITLTLLQSNETVTLTHEIQINNMP